MTHFGALVDPSKTKEWNAILQTVLEEKHKINPGCPLSEAYAEAWVKFQHENWMSEAREDIALNKQEYAKMDAGPDLTALSRTRYGIVKKKKSAKKGKSRGPTSYNIFMKTMYEEHKEEWKNLTPVEKLKMISEMWKETTEEDRKKYK